MFPSSPDRQPARVPEHSPIDAYRRAFRAADPRPSSPSAESSSERAVAQADGEP